MIDHLGIGVKDYAAAKRFYQRALAPLGYALMMEITPEMKGGGAAACGLGRDGKPDFWIADEDPATNLHIAFTAEDRAAVDAFHAAALAAGGRDNGAPGVRAQYHPNYYGAFVWDLDGNNVEAVCHAPGDAADQTTS